VLIDGEGNAWIWVDEDTPLDYACDILTSGALRYNGQTCTSINGAVVHPRIYDQLQERLVDRWKGIKFGSPVEAGIQVGPLMSEAQTEQCLARIESSGATVLVGGHRHGSLMAPTLAAEPSEASELVSHGFFAPALWIAPGDAERFAALWPRNRYPLCAGVLTRSDDVKQHLDRMPNLARLTVNGDPSLEYLYEPWGAYPASGTNTVSHWHRKYLRTVQVDAPA
jgi:acyl-CoA reductase-like NAD-dependent aldehyde dehydrogenase